MNPADGDVAAVMIEMTALGRYGQGDEVAGMVSYLASPEALLSRARASKLMAALPLERDVIKFVIPKEQENTMSQKLSGKSCACHWRLQRHRSYFTAICR